MIKANPALFTQLAAYPNPATIPPMLLAQAVTAAGGGAKGTVILTTISANTKAIDGVIAVAPQLATVTPYAAQLTALSKVPPQVFPYLMNVRVVATSSAGRKCSGRSEFWPAAPVPSLPRRA